MVQNYFFFYKKKFPLSCEDCKTNARTQTGVVLTLQSTRLQIFLHIYFS